MAPQNLGAFGNPASNDGKRRREQDLAAPPVWKRKLLQGSQFTSGVVVPVLPLPKDLDLDFEENEAANNHGSSSLFREEMETLELPSLPSVISQARPEMLESFRRLVSPSYFPLETGNKSDSDKAPLSPSGVHNDDLAFAAQLLDYKRLSTTRRE
ncbi:uncharacterized protein LOC9631333 [Selaginella moellendorffii]|uniref:uncharacterized protein LOC9631333 n=1 Tax=Selaginella moellendorffii TaxID=88036 RepID=UPI000D1CA829|nr:uncharacterized protein LOC9631333 [Selaginella moellendorffii]|eukprot:XP_024520013.1 uncharacterized protein LOC9631333 [Selaginella moellendorffii]